MALDLFCRYCEDEINTFDSYVRIVTDDNREFFAHLGCFIIGAASDTSYAWQQHQAAIARKNLQ